MILRVLGKIYKENPNIRDYIRTPMINICKEENHPQSGILYFVYFFFDVVFITKQTLMLSLLQGSQ